MVFLSKTGLSGRKLRILITAVLLSTAFFVSGQETDNELWTGPTFRMDVFNKFRIEFEQQARFFNNISEFKNTFSEFGIKYTINKIFSVKGNYRYISRAEKNNRHRISASFYSKLDTKVIPLVLTHRLKFQDTREPISGDIITVLRNKLAFDYNLCKLVDPFLEGELYYRLNKINDFRTSRITAGLEWRITKNIDLTTYYRLQKEINIINPNKDNIIGLMFCYDF